MDHKRIYKKIVTRKQVWISFFLMMLLSIFAALIITPHIPEKIWGSSYFNSFEPKLGLDLKGGAHLVYQADLSLVGGDTVQAMEGVRDVIEKRVNSMGLSEPLVNVSGTDRLIVELPGVTDVADAIKKIGETPTLVFKEEISEEELKQAESGVADQVDKINASIQETAKQTLKDVLSGGNFAELAKTRSADNSAENGGQLDWAKKDVYVKEFNDVVFNKLKKGEIYKQLVKTEFGYHIIRLDDIRGEGENKEVLASHILFKTKTAKELLAALGNDAVWKTTQLNGKFLDSAVVAFDPNTQQPLVTLQFNSEGAKLFEELTQKNLGKRIAIFLDGGIISAPRVNSVIAGGSAQITGMNGVEEAKELAKNLNAGALPVPVSLLSQQTVGASLGIESLHASIIAGLIGFILIALFMVVFYRLPGLVAIFALTIYSVLILAIFEMIPITLTLAGVAGYILSIGMAVDANVLIFERFKEEIRRGNSYKTSVEEGFIRAWSSIRDSNTSSLITCFILYITSTSVVRGFAITLGIGILVSVFTSVNITRAILRLLDTEKLQKFKFLFDYTK